MRHELPKDLWSRCRNSSGIMPRTPPPSTLKILTPAVGGFNRIRRWVPAPHRMHVRNVKVYSSVIRASPYVLAQWSQIACRHFSTCSGRRKIQIEQKRLLRTLAQCVLVKGSCSLSRWKAAGFEWSFCILFQPRTNSRKTKPTICSRSIRCAAVFEHSEP